MVSLLFLLAAPSGCSTTPADAREKEHPDLPDEYRRLLERGTIASVDAPEFVSAGEADMPPGAWIFGVDIGGEARAYSLNLLNRHEVVNDLIGGKPIAAVW